MTRTVLGIIGGSALLDEPAPAGTRPARVETRRGAVTVHQGEGFVFLRRHGETYHPPHRVRHAAHALALAELGVRAAVGLCSVGSMDPTLAPGAVIVPGDYLSLAPPPTLAEGDQRLHIVPTLDRDLRAALAAAAQASGPVRNGGVYAETRGPRFETRAEIRMLADHADVVGMTAASEATLLQEAGVLYAVLGIVDNFAHGVGDEALTLERYEAQLAENRSRARTILGDIIERAGRIA